MVTRSSNESRQLMSDSLARDRQGLIVMTLEECERLLEARSIGRIALLAAGEPLILPVVFQYVHGAVVFRTAPGEKLDAVWQNAPAAFEIDDWDTTDPHRLERSCPRADRGCARRDPDRRTGIAGTREVGALPAAHDVGPYQPDRDHRAADRLARPLGETSIPTKCEAEAGCLPSGLTLPRGGSRQPALELLEPPRRQRYPSSLA